MPPKDAASMGTPPGRGDRLSDLRNEVLFRVMGHLKAWEAVRACALSTRWRNLWASASRLDIRHPWPCHDLATFVRNLLLRRRPRAPLDSLRLCWCQKFWIAYAVRHGAEEIELSGEHHFENPSPEYVRFIVDGDDFAKNHLKILKLVHVRLDGTTLTQLCSRCICLEELELKDCQIPEITKIRSTMLKHLAMIKCQVPSGFLVYALNIVSLHCIRPFAFGYVPWIENLGSPGIVNTVIHRTPDEYPEYTEPVSCNLKILKLSHVHLDDTILRQLCSRCTSLEELELRNCSIDGEEIGSTSLKYLTMIICKFSIGFRVQAPNLVLLRCIKPCQHFPLIQKMEFLVTATIVLDDYCLLPDCQWLQEDDDSDDNNNDDSDHYFGDNKHKESDGTSNYYDSDRSAPSDKENDDRTVGYGDISKEHIHKAYKYLINGHKPSADNSGGVGMLLSLSNVKSMDLLAHPGEMLLTRGLKSCTDFNNLKTLSLGEWCITPGFHVLAAMLGHSPNLENLFLHLDVAFNSRLDFNPKATSFKCTNLKMVNITCCKHDVVVHTLAYFFSENSIPNDKIFVHWTGCSGCTGGTTSQKRMMQNGAEKSEAKKMKEGN